MDGDASKTSTDNQVIYKPDDVIQPHSTESPAVVNSAAEILDTAQPPQPEAASAAPTAEVGAPQPEVSQPNVIPEAMASSEPYEPMSDVISWTASEFIAHEKPTGWYVLIAAGAVVAAAITWLVTRDIMPTSAVFIGITLLAFYASHKPNQQQYQLDESGLTIGNRHLPYHEFRSFAVMPEGAFLSVELTPLRRFSMYATLYLDPADEERIISYLSMHLPMEEAKPSLTDDLMRRIRF
jgi:hypothetical protein